MKKKIGLICLALVLALGSLGVAFAMWSETLFIDATVETGELDWEFVYNSHTQKDPCDPPTNDWNSAVGMLETWQLTKDVGCTAVGYTDTDGDGDYDRLDVTVNNAYPCYYEHIAFKLHNNGSIPLIIQKVIINPGNHEYTSAMGVPIQLDLDSDGKPDIEVWYGDSFATQLHPCWSADISFDFHILQDAPQDTTDLQFSIEIVAVQWNEY